MNTSGSELVFLISQPRAGSTVLQLILREHPLVSTVAEPWIALHPVFSLKPEGIEAGYDAFPAHSALLAYLESTGISREKYMEYIRDFLLKLYAPLSGEGRLVLDKTPRYYYIIEELAQLFPQAKFIILLRNPADVMKSIIKTWVGDDWARLALCRNDLMIAPKKLCEGIAVLGERAVCVHYEDFTAAPNRALEPVFDHLGLVFEPEFLNYGARTPHDWKFGDQVGVRRSESLRNPSDDPTSLCDVAKNLICQYIEQLGPELFCRMGYAYEQTRALYEVAGSSTSYPSLKLLIKESETLQDLLEFGEQVFRAKEECIAADRFEQLKKQYNQSDLKDGKSLRSLMERHAEHVRLNRNAALCKQKRERAAIAPVMANKELVQAFVAERLRSLQFQHGKRARVALFGNGAHTTWLLRLITEKKIELQVGEIYDDAATFDSQNGAIPVLRPEKGMEQPFDLIILSTDTLAARFRTRILEIWGKDVLMVDLYEPLGFEGPFQK